MTTGLSDKAFIRYSRQIMLPDIAEAGQLALTNAKVLIVGAGGLGCAAAMYLAAAGVGRIDIADGDAVELSNLQRQVLFSVEDINQNKAQCAQQRLSLLNPLVTINAIAQHLTSAELHDRVPHMDLVLDCTDNTATRHAVNQACVSAMKPLVSGAASGFDGQLAVFSNQAASACYHCLFPANHTSQQPSEAQNCGALGVIAPLVGVVGSMQAMQAIKILCGLQTSTFFMTLPMLSDLASNSQAADVGWQVLSIQPDPHCKVCAQCNSQADQASSSLSNQLKPQRASHSTTALPKRMP
ncbi:HesA/MoeB/ThiF family protein [Flocculibacter collagenilyticus]|uniref:HesA/MoeB/ThiF family protein n=1 Tax=Flocculibacter collagenilyticus TaxID=2744479 RepID=UPI0018F5EE0E|nr:HesA/MoeB/ThiF family protein [Flocculibacter collagenilyticus]